MLPVLGLPPLTTLMLDHVELSRGAKHGLKQVNPTMLSTPPLSTQLQQLMEWSTALWRADRPEHMRLSGNEQ